MSLFESSDMLKASQKSAVGPLPTVNCLRGLVEADNVYYLATNLQQNKDNLTCSGTCWLASSNVQIIYWPEEWPENNEISTDNTSTSMPLASSGVVSNGMTL